MEDLPGRKRKLRVEPRNEHFINLLIALGTSNTSKKPKLLKSIFQHGNLSLDLWEFE